MRDATVESWKHLQDLVSTNPSIIISEHEWKIPDDLKEEFYKHFDAIRRNFVKDYCGFYLSESKDLIDNYRQAENEIKSLGLKHVFHTKEQSSFIENPADHFAWKVWDPLSDALRSEFDFNAFKEKSVRTVKFPTRQIFAFVTRIGFRLKVLSHKWMSQVSHNK